MSFTFHGDRHGHGPWLSLLCWVVRCLRYLFYWGRCVHARLQIRRCERLRVELFVSSHFSCGICLSCCRKWGLWQVKGWPGGRDAAITPKEDADWYPQPNNWCCYFERLYHLQIFLSTAMPWAGFQRNAHENIKMLVHGWVKHAEQPYAYRRTCQRDSEAKD